MDNWFLSRLIPFVRAGTPLNESQRSVDPLTNYIDGPPHICRMRKCNWSENNSSRFASVRGPDRPFDFAQGDRNPLCEPTCFTLSDTVECNDGVDDTVVGRMTAQSRFGCP